MNRNTWYCQNISSFKVIYRFDAIWFKFPATFCVKINKLILKFIWRSQRLKLSNTVLRNNKVGGLRKSDFKIYYKTAAI